MSKQFWITWLKRLLIVPPIVLAVLGYMWLVKNTPPLQERTEEESARMLETINVQRLDVRPKVSGFGTAKYARSWRAVSQVEGRIKKVHPQLRPGSMIQAGEVLLEIDDSDYRSRVDELNATIEKQDAEIHTLEQSILNDEKVLAIEIETLKILQRNFDIQTSLSAQNATSISEVDEARRDWLSQQKAIQDLKNKTALYAPQIKALQAGKRQAVAQIEQAKRDVERAKITAPFRIRIGNVQLEVDQFVTVGEALFMGYSEAEMEIETQLPLQDIHRLLVSQNNGVLPKTGSSGDDYRRAFSFEILVEVAGMETRFTYPGRFLRVREMVDTKTKMVGFVVGVKNGSPPDQIVSAPPLLEGAFCNVDVYGKTLAQQVVIPRCAIRNGSVYLVDDDNRLATQNVEIKFTQDDYAVVASGLDGDETLVVANPSPAIIGMLVEPIESHDTTDMLIRSVSAETYALSLKQDTTTLEILE